MPHASAAGPRAGPVSSAGRSLQTLLSCAALMRTEVLTCPSVCIRMSSTIAQSGLTRLFTVSMRCLPLTGASLHVVIVGRRVSQQFWASKHWRSQRVELPVLVRQEIEVAVGLPNQLVVAALEVHNVQGTLHPGARRRQASPPCRGLALGCGAVRGAGRPDRGAHPAASRLQRGRAGAGSSGRTPVGHQRI